MNRREKNTFVSLSKMETFALCDVEILFKTTGKWKIIFQMRLTLTNLWVSMSMEIVGSFQNTRLKQHSLLGIYEKH